MLIYKKSFPVESINVLWKQFPTRDIVILTINTLLLGASIGTGVYYHCNAHDDMNYHIASMLLAALSFGMGITTILMLTAYSSTQVKKFPKDQTTIEGANASQPTNTMIHTPQSS